MATAHRVLVLDASAFIAGFDPSSVAEVQYSVPAVGRELVPNSLPWVRFNTAVDGGRLKVEAPTTHALKRVREASKRVGDACLLSEADLEVLALALQLKEEERNPQIVTDDYSIQNVADQLEIEFVPLMTFGIRFRLQWILYCPACYRKYPSDYGFKSCQVCGTKLRRKPLKKRAVGKGK